MCEVYEKPEERLQLKILIRGLRDHHPSSKFHQSFIKSSCITSIFQFLLIKNYFSWRTIPSHIICSYVATNIMYGCMDPRIFCPPMSRVPFCQCQLTAVWSISTMSPHQTIRHPAMFPLTSKETIKDDGQTDKKEKTKKWNDFTILFWEKLQRNVSLNDWIWFAVALSEFAEALSENSWTMTCVLRRNLWRYNCGRPKEVFG